MKKHIRKIKTCVNCRHLEILEEGQEIKGLDETSYIAFRCDVFNYIGKEIFSFPLGDRRVIIERNDDDECPFWEEWRKENEESSGLIDSLENDIKSDDPDV